MTVQELVTKLKAEKQTVPARALDENPPGAKAFQQYRIVSVENGSFDKDGKITPCVFLKVEPV